MTFHALSTEEKDRIKGIVKAITGAEKVYYAPRETLGAHVFAFRDKEGIPKGYMIRDDQLNRTDFETWFLAIANAEGERVTHKDDCECCGGAKSDWK